MLVELDHPILQHKLNIIRDINTSQADLRSILQSIGELTVYEVLKDVKTFKKKIKTWIGVREFSFIEEKKIVFIAILRAGLPMLEGALRVIPFAKVGFLALKRNEKTLKADLFYSRLPDICGKRVIILDPMLATGSSLTVALREIKKGNPERTESVHIVSAPEGIGKVLKEFPNHELYTVSVDEKLNSKGYIIPGLGDMGDRLYS